MNGATAWGPLLGGVGGAGLLLVMSWLRARRPVPMLQRIAPFVSGSVHREVSAWDDVVVWARTMRDRVAPAPGSLTWMSVAGAAGAVLGVVLAAGGQSALLVVVLGAVGAVGGAWACGQHRAQRVRQWRTDIDAQLPAVADLLSFSVTAGESLVAGIDRVAATLDGSLARELREAHARIQAGAGIEVSLRAVGAGVASFERFVDALVVALERGTPLADVLRAQADDIRGARRRTLLELAGRKDVLMLVPVVFLILPTVVLIALFPAAQALRLLSS